MERDFEIESEFYQKALRHPSVGEPGRRYLRSRGLNDETIRVWEIGWCPIGHPVYRKLRGRITFPVRDQNGRIVTISGRKAFTTLPGPKYDMYPFSATKVLFGLWQNRGEIRNLNRAVVTEGQIDVIMAWQKGFRIATSTFGAHGTPWHLALLARYAQRIDVLYDADTAGERGLEAIKRIGAFGDLDVRFKNPFPQGDDLDSWIQGRNADELFNLLDKDENLSNLKIRLHVMKGNG